MKEYNLTKTERLILFNQYSILSELANNAGDKNTADIYEAYKTILVDGYKYEYSQLFDDFGEELSKTKSNFVRNVLKMYRAIYDKARTLSPEEKERYGEHKLKFHGFDGNEETEYFLYCKFIIEDMGEYAEIYENGKNGLNSHCNTINYYNKLLKIWMNAGKPYELSDDLFDDLMQAQKSIIKVVIF